MDFGKFIINEVVFPEILKDFIEIFPSIDIYRILDDIKRVESPILRILADIMLLNIINKGPVQRGHIQRVQIWVILVLRISESDDHLILIQTSFMRIDRFRKISAFYDFPLMGIEVIFVQRVGVINEPYHSSKKI